ncbi:D-alanyl-D-alanine carboxypeptidase family protein [Sphingomonas sp. CFBP9019]|uniref:D-alanyl-D-alanine carboxypeptidase family protein n=1 Tax=Sphingomonas sp. CFBP9019 TaxID=3096532 RepID=UPI002A6B613C|nr:D-alanyl-D-alanine carboxypeptidase family protein [Sphingomonas sp. CFBP9019]MDY1010270.1 D-alanyl-D-alanine carboxypeptidase family protein [Sphingomonas sp. CFBP9019]
MENFNSGISFSSLRRSQICFIVASLAFGLPGQAAYARSRVFEIVVDASTGTVLFSEAPDAARRPASLIKLMTFYLAFEAHADGRLRLSDPLPISRRAARQPAMHLGIASGGRITVGKALDAIAAISSNDLAVAVAERIAGSEPKFARLLTAKARQLGMRNTRFANASGLTSAGNMTTASDMAKLSRAIVRRFPQQYARFSKRTIQWRSRRTANHNHLLGRVTGVDGIKTEYTSDAGYKLAASAMRRDRRCVEIGVSWSSCWVRPAFRRVMRALPI